MNRTAHLLILAALCNTVPAVAQRNRIHVERSELVVDRLSIEQDGVPWSFVELRYPRAPWSDQVAAAWGRPGTTLLLGTRDFPLTIASGSFVGTGEEGESGFDTSEGDGPETLQIRFRGPEDFQDDPELMVESTPLAALGRADTLGAAATLEFTHELLDPPAAALRVRLRTTAAEPVRGEDGQLTAKAELSIDFGPHRLRTPLFIDLPVPIPSRSGTRVPEPVLRAIETARTFEFLELPGATVDDQGGFRGYLARGRRECDDPVLRRRVASTLARAALMGPTWTVDCFEPELGVRLRDPVLGDFDLLISASCSAIQIHGPHRDGDDAETAGAHLDEAITAELIRIIDAACDFER